MKPTRSRNLILTSYDEVSLVKFAPFLHSLGKFAPDSHLVFFTRDASKLETIFRGMGLDAEAIVSDFRVGGSCIPVLARFKEYQNYLLNHKGEFDKVILCDCADLAFLSDPFPLITDSIVVAEESYTPTRENPTNVHWAHPLPLGATSLYFDEPIICAGFIAGTEIPLLLDQLMEKLDILAERESHVDQPLVNFLVRGPLASKSKVLPVRNPLIEHLNNNPQVSDPFPAVVHMYTFQVNEWNVKILNKIFSSS